ncbi:entericidin A/B family lipoprotein [Roseobacteraceae bacterium NS-SX3]
MIRALLIALALLPLAACETAKGAGRDISKAGDTITGVAQDIQRKF